MWKTNSLCSDDMSLLVFVKTCHPFNSHVVRFRSPGRKNNVLWISTNQVGNVLIYIHENKEMWKAGVQRRTFLASSTPFSASQPYACVRLCGFPYWSVK